MRTNFSRSYSRFTASKLFIPSRIPPKSKDNLIKSHKYLLGAGFLRQCFSGGYYLLPLAQRCFEKLARLVDCEMQKIGGVKIGMPILAPASLWKQSGRWESIGKELFRLSDQNDTEFCLGPTHEEVVTDLVSKELKSHRQLPLRLYQLDRKFRDELRPKQGLLRAREFWMKDMYTFDESPSDAMETYEIVCGAYSRIFQQLNITTMKVLADPGNIGGSLSHEYHVTAPVGDDILVTCLRCGSGSSIEVLGCETKSHLPNCPEDGSNCELTQTKGIEVAHAFYLGTKYSQTFNASFVDQNGNSKVCQMGCYGIGVSRLLQAVVEHQLMRHNRMVWPSSMAPFTACVTPLYNIKNSTCDVTTRVERICDSLNELFPGDVLLDDRSSLSIGEKLGHIDLIGYPVSIVLGKNAPPGHVEVHFQMSEKKVIDIVEEHTLLEYIKNQMSVLFHDMKMA